MHRLLLPLFLSLFLFYSCSSPAGADPQKKDSAVAATDTAGIDTSLIRKLHADDHGMKKYVMAFLKKGPNRDQDSATAAALMRAHLDNIGRMAKEGKLVLAGPFLDDTELSGIYIFNVETIEEARALTETDPAIKAGRLVMELHPWYGSAALQEIVKMHGKISRKKI